MRQFSLYVHPEGHVRGHSLVPEADHRHLVFSAQFDEATLTFGAPLLEPLVMNTDIVAVDLQFGQFSFADWREHGFQPVGHVMLQDEPTFLRTVGLDSVQSGFLLQWTNFLTEAIKHVQGARMGLSAADRNNRDAWHLLNFLTKRGSLNMAPGAPKALTTGELPPTQYGF